jgi:tetratricopeptide (TPR) repeat protein
MLERSVELDPGYADAYALRGFLDWLAYLWQWGSGPRALDLAAEQANKAIALDDSSVVAYAVRGWVAAMQGKRDQAIADSAQAVSLDPNLAFAWIARADINLSLSGKPQETLVYVQNAKRLDPRHPALGCNQEGAAYDRMGRYLEAIDALKSCEPSNPWPHVFLVFAYFELVS